MNVNPVLEIQNIDKRFGLTYANRKINLSLMPGEVRGLAGENGSGKSTLVSILAGIHQKDGGTILKNGAPYEVSTPIQAIQAKVGIVVQELGLVPNLPLGANIFLGQMNKFKGAFGLLDMDKLYQEGEALLLKWGLGSQVPLHEMAVNTSVETRKLAELARALSIDPDILILDEVTHALSQDKRTELFKIMDICKAQGKSIVIISHDLEELLNITDSITVLRDGAVVDTCASKNLTVDELKKMMVGRSIEGNYYGNDDPETKIGDVALQVANLCGGHGAIEGVSFDLHKGEILAVCGLSDAGIHDLGKVLVGLEPQTAGTVTLQPSGCRIRNPQQAKRNKICYLPKDRDAEAMMLQTSIQDNFCLPSARELSKPFGFLTAANLETFAQEGIEKFDVKCSGADQLCGDLSGGNKQKVNLGRWMLKDIDIYVFDCPTRGVDVGVKAFIYGLMRQCKRDGAAILLISDELPEAIGMADRIMIMKGGQVKKIVSLEEGFSEERIVEVMM